MPLLSPCAEPTYQNPPGTLYFPANPQDARGQSIIYPTYAPNLNIAMHPSYHMELSQGPPPPQQQQQGPPPQSSQSVNQPRADSRGDSRADSRPTVYHINLDQTPPQQHQQQQQQGPPSQKMQPQKGHVQQISLEKYHMEKGPVPPPPNHMPEGMYRMPMLPAGIMALPPQNQQVQDMLLTTILTFSWNIPLHPFHSLRVCSEHTL